MADMTQYMLNTSLTCDVVHNKAQIVLRLSYTVYVQVPLCLTHNMLCCVPVHLRPAQDIPTGWPVCNIWPRASPAALKGGK